MLDNSNDFSGVNEVADFDQKALDLPRYAGTNFNFRTPKPFDECPAGSPAET